MYCTWDFLSVYKMNIIADEVFYIKINVESNWLQRNSTSGSFYTDSSLTAGVKNQPWIWVFGNQQMVYFTVFTSSC